MKRRTFLATAAAAAAMPPVSISAGPSAGAFWARYLTALHGPVPARTIATFANRSALPAVAAATGMKDAEARALRRAARWLSDDRPETEEDT